MSYSIKELSRKALLALFVALLFGMAPEVYAQTGSCTSATGDAYFDGNNVRARILTNGNLFWRGDPYVYEVPKGGGANAVFAGGFWIGGLVDGQLRVAAARYGNYNFWSGPIDENGNPPADCSVYDRIWKINRSDIQAVDGGGAPTNDLASWPTGLGAPTLAPADDDEIDNDGDGEVDEAGEMKRLHEEILQQPLSQRIDRVIDLAAGERPEMYGDQMLWWIMNDRGNVHGGTQTPPIGVEAHAMVFGFNQAGDIGNATFYRVNLFMKANNPLEQAYVALFSDPDLGDFQDDYVGSDTTLGVGFVYNSDNLDAGGYGPNPPALGYDFFQGPIVPSAGDTALVAGRDVPDFRNLPMTSFVYYNNGGGLNEDPQVGSDYYNYFQARWKDGRPIRAAGDGFDVDESVPATNFMYPGDPVQAEFWSELNNDGQQTANTPADRRFVMSSGPFTVNPGDQQEIVYGIVWARGNDHLDSVNRMRGADRRAQAAFDANFELPNPPDPPVVTVTPFNRAVAIEWTNPASSNNYQNSYREFNPLGNPDNPFYEFEGYEVIRYTSAQDQQGTVVSTYDIDNGITDIIDDLNEDGITELTTQGRDLGLSQSHIVTGLVNYQTYYFGVRAYAYNDGSIPKAFYSPTSRFEVRPSQSAKVLNEDAVAIALTGTRADGTPGEITGGVTSGVGGGKFSVSVANPATIQDADYSIDFFDHMGFTTYDITNTTSSTKIFDGAEYVEAIGTAPTTTTQLGQGLSVTVTDPQTNYAPEPFAPYDGGRGRPLQREFFMGLDGETESPSPGTVVRFYSRQLDTPPTDSVDTDDDGVNDAIDPDSYEPEFVGDFDDDGTPDTVRAITEVAGPGGADPCTDPVGCVNGERVVDYPFPSSGGLFTMPIITAQSQTSLPGYAPNTYEFRFVEPDLPNGSFVAHIFTTGYTALWAVEAWDIGDVGPGEANDPSDDVRMVITPFSDCGLEVSFDYDCDVGHDAPVSDRLYAYYYSPDHTHEEWTDAAAVVALPNQPGAAMTFSTTGLGARSQTNDEAVASLEEIGVVPNPYKGASSYEVSQLTDEVRFTNLPDVATIRVFTLNGTLVRTLQKNSPGRRDLSWDLTTEESLPLASGMYLIHVEVPGVGERVIKFAVIKKRIQLNVF